jgi:hypothetical protein
MSTSYDRILTQFLVLVVRFLAEVLVLISVEVCESTTGEYICTQQALTIGGKEAVCCS